VAASAVDKREYGMNAVEEDLVEVGALVFRHEWRYTCRRRDLLLVGLDQGQTGLACWSV
jgi:hypothetical protein